MKKFVFGMIAGVIGYKVVMSRGVRKRLKARFTLYKETFISSFFDRVMDNAKKNGVTDAEMEELLRLLMKVSK